MASLGLSALSYELMYCAGALLIAILSQTACDYCWKNFINWIILTRFYANLRKKGFAK